MKNIAILTSGGDAPGMNTALFELTKYAYENKINTYGIYKGYLGLYKNYIYKLNFNSIKPFENKGGTFLQSARFEEFKNKEIQKIAAENLKKKKIDTLIIIGGDGSYLGAEQLANNFAIKCICLPGTIDNNIKGTEYTIGFFTALNTIYESIEKIKDTAFSHRRIFLIEIMGNTSDQLTIYSSIGTGSDIMITSKNNFDYKKLKNKICKIINSQKENLIITIKENITNIQQLAKNLEKDIKKEVKSIILGHIQRGGSPNVLDAILARRLSHYAINYYLNNNFKNKLIIKIGILNNIIIDY